MITLTPRAEQCLQVLHALDRGDLLMAEAAELLGRSVRHVRRLRGDYRVRGVLALIHGNRGQIPWNRIADDVRARIVRLATTTYAEVNDHHLQELLGEREGLTLSRPSLRRILRKAGVRSPRRRRPPRHRRRRERMPQQGLLVQLDGSDHDWLQQRGPRLTLIAAIDDATGEVLAATFRDEEDAHGYLVVLRTLAQTHGIFRKTQQPPLTLHEQLQGGPRPRRSPARCKNWGSAGFRPAARRRRGRIERLFGTFQDRLRAELRLARVATRDGANAFLREFLPRYNARFAQPPANPRSAYRPWPADLDPHTVFCFKYRRTVGNDNTVTLGGQRIQLLPGPQHRSYAKAVVEVHERLDGRLALLYQGVPVLCHRLAPAATIDRIPARGHPRVHPTPTQSVRHGRNGGIEIATPSRKTRPGTSEKASLNPDAGSCVTHRQQWKPAPDHPWRHMLVGKAKLRPPVARGQNR